MALTFGRTTVGDGDINFENYIRGSVFTCPETCIADKLTGYILISSLAKNIKGAIYKRSDLSFVGSTQIVNVPTQAYVWTDFIFDAPKPQLTGGTEYILVFWSKAGLGHSRLHRKAGFPVGHALEQYLVYTDWPANCDTPGENTEYCIFCTYTSLTNPYPTAQLKKGLLSGYHVFLNQYIKAKIQGYDPLKLPDGTIF